MEKYVKNFSMHSWINDDLYKYLKHEWYYVRNNKIKQRKHE